MNLILAVLIAGALFDLLPQVARPDDQAFAGLRFSGTVSWVSDGDTIRVNGHNFPLRLWGIDAAERDTEAGARAHLYLQELAGGQIADCERIAIDKYRRTVARCSIAKGDLSALMIAADHAKEYCSFSGNYYGTC